MEVKRICKWCGKPFIGASQGYKHRMRERRLELRELQDLIEVKSKLDHQDYFTFAQAAQLMGVSRQYIYKLVKEDKLRASRISARMSIIRRADIELMLKTRPYERRRVKDDLDITEYNRVLHCRANCRKVQSLAEMDLGIYKREQYPQNPYSPVQLLQQKTYRCSVCQVQN